jgi:hypothetical protein
MTRFSKDAPAEEYVYELAQTRQEAIELAEGGFGYDTRAAAIESKKKALKDGADSFYINKLKVFRVLV